MSTKMLYLNQFSELDLENVLKYYGIKYIICGNELKFICPFHNDTQPSCCFNKEKGVFHCFGCGVSGSVVSFIQKMENISYNEAVDKLNSLFGFEVSEIQSHPSIREIKTFIERINKLKKKKHKVISEEFIMKCRNTMEYDYWLKRGFKKETLDFFEVGFCREGIYTGRYVIPLRDDKGFLVGFSSRGVKNDKTSKYVHMPGVKKSNLLYNLHNVKKYNKNKINEMPILVVEGFSDVWKAWEYGWRKAVAIMGSSLSDEQVMLLVSNTYDVIFAFDGDEAGQKATLEAIKKCSLYLNIYVNELETGKDIADLTKSEFVNFIKNLRKIKRGEI